ncbi:hypothetical protein EDB87DRAFT_1549809, partial [Lactarius vividus]
PKSVAQYLAWEWIPVKEMWSAMYCQNRTIFEEGNTNMLLEAYHHVLKSKWLDGKCNCRVDHLISALMKDALPAIEDHLKRQGIWKREEDLASRRQHEI